MALIFPLGSQGALLQSVAWLGMMVKYSKDAPLAEALSKTFDGKHPCRLCKAIQQSRASEKQREASQSKLVTKLDAGLVWQAAAFDFNPGGDLAVANDLDEFSRRDAPPRPRPRPLLPCRLS